VKFHCSPTSIYNHLHTSFINFDPTRISIITMKQQPQSQQPAGKPVPVISGLTVYDAHGKPTTSPFQHLITPDLIKAAQSSSGLAPELKYAKVLDSEYTVKLGPGVSHYEYRVLQFLNTIPNTPVPKALDFFIVEFLLYDLSITKLMRWNVMVMSTIPGVNLPFALYSKRDEVAMEQAYEMAAGVLREVKAVMDHINTAIQSGAKFPNPEGDWEPLSIPADSVSSLDGDRGRFVNLPLYNSWSEGSLKCSDFVNTMSAHAQQAPKACATDTDTVDLLQTVLERYKPIPSELRFCHMDLHPDNIIVNNGKLGGIVDWEMAGWFTWKLEMLGAMKFCTRPAAIRPYLTAWNPPDELDMKELTERSLGNIRRGNSLWQREHRAQEREGKSNPFAGWRESQRARRKIDAKIAKSTMPDVRPSRGPPRFLSLITPELITRARSHHYTKHPLKYAEVIDPQHTVKLGPGVLHYEYRVLHFLNTLEDVPVSQPLEFFDIEVPLVDYFGKVIGGKEIWHVMVISTMPGKDMGELVRHLKPEEEVVILRDVMRVMERINSTINAGALFPNSHGEWSQLERKVTSVSDLDGNGGRSIQLPFYAGLIDGSVRIEDFVSTMAEYAQQPPDTAELLLSTLHYLGPNNVSDIRFCHMDLHSNNIMVHNGRLSGIIDWELAGWYTWRLEVWGGMKELHGPDAIYPYIEGWNVPSDLEQVITRSSPRLARGHDLWEEEQAEAELRSKPNPFENWHKQQH